MKSGLKITLITRDGEDTPVPEDQTSVPLDSSTAVVSLEIGAVEDADLTTVVMNMK